MEQIKTLKIVIGGDGGIGKTTLMTRFSQGTYHNHDITIGVDIHVKRIKAGGLTEIVQVWDLSGQDQFRFLLDTFFKKAHGIILGFDMSQRQSFMHLNKWIQLFRDHKPHIPIFLIATKADLGYHPALDKTMAIEFVEKFHLIGFAEVSAKTNLNIDLPFIKLIEEIESCSFEDVQVMVSDHLGD